MAEKNEYSKSGSPIIHYGKEKEWQAPIMEDEESSNKIEEHINKFIGETALVFHEIVSDTVHIDVYHIRPTNERKYHTFITMGMSSLPMKAPENAAECQYAELMICLPPSWEIPEEKYQVTDFDNLWPVGYMKYLARFPHKYDTWLWFGHTIPNGNPMTPFDENTKLCGAILLPPIKTNDDFHQLKISEEKTLNFFAVVPIYEEEMNYKLRHGTDKLLDRFDKYHVSEILDVNRVNTCKKSFWFL